MPAAVARSPKGVITYSESLHVDTGGVEYSIESVFNSLGEASMTLGIEAATPDDDGEKSSYGFYTAVRTPQTSRLRSLTQSSI